MSGYLFLLLLVVIISTAEGASKNKPHGHKGALEPYTGRPLPVTLTADQKKKLDNGEAVVFNERSGSSGRGVVIQDVNASQPICMDRIRDLPNYKNMVPHVKKVEVYSNNKFFNGTSKTGARMDVGVMGLNFGYFLLLTHEPKYNTLTWTLDYQYNSDFDDNCGHWQVMPHPSKRGWTRVLYSCKIKLFPWIPEFIIKFLTSKALVESTGWVKKEAEAEQRKQGGVAGLGVPSWLNFKGGLSSMPSPLDSFTNKLSSIEKDMDAQRRRLFAGFSGFKFKFGS